MSAPIGPTCERIWIAYLTCIAVVTLMACGGGSPGHDVGKCLLLHGTVLVGVALSHRIAVRRSHDAARVWRVALGLCGLPAVFTGLCWLLPGVHPEPYEFVFLALDRAVFGTDVGNFVDVLPPIVVEVLQLIYAAFYGICIVAALGAGRGSGRAAFDRAVVVLTSVFLFSYLGYLLVPTLAPKVVLAFANDIRGVWLVDGVRAAIDAGEANPWDCFPSGHTMLTITSLIVLWRWHRPWFRWLLVPAVLLIASTMILRYHWVIDVVAGALLAWPAVRCCDWLMDVDGWPAAGVRTARTPSRPASAPAGPSTAAR